jgi:rSAM/selenodomain-associated transferase 2
VKVSVVIPALNEAEHVLHTLLSIQQQPGEFEIIVADGGSSDDTVKLVQPYARVICCGRGRAIQMNVGARQTTGEALLFLYADTTLPPQGLAHLCQALAEGAVGGTFCLRFDLENFWLKLYTFFTRFRFRYFHYGDQGIFVKRTVFEQLGGFKEIPLMEDIDLICRLHQLGRVALIKTPVTTSARRYLEQGVVRQQLLNTWLVLLYMVGVSPQRLADWYWPEPSSSLASRFLKNIVHR